METKKPFTVGVQVMIKNLSGNKIARVEYSYEWPENFQVLKDRYDKILYDATQNKNLIRINSPEDLDFGTYQVVPVIGKIEIWNRNIPAIGVIELDLAETRTFLAFLDEIRNLPAESRDLGEIYL